MSHSTSVTTGHRNEVGTWMARGLGVNRHGNSRGPPPTCTIPIGRGTTVTMPIADEQNWAPRIADNLMMEPGSLIMAQLEESQLTGRASGSHESTQDDMHANGGSRGLLSEEGDEGSQQEQSEISDDEEDLKAAKSVKPAYKRGRKGKEKKKVGRPIAYRGDPNAPELTDLERRRIKRRIANRESARRVRHKRQEELEDMQIKMEQIQAHSNHLQQHANTAREQKDMIAAQLHEMHQKYDELCGDNKQLVAEITALRQSLQLKMSALEEELDKRATEAEGAMTHLDFYHPPAQQRPLSPLSQAPHALISQHPLDGRSGASASLDWLPSLDLDEFTQMDIVNNFFEEAPASGQFLTREAISKP